MKWACGWCQTSSLSEQCVKFLLEKGLIKDKDGFISAKPLKEAPMFIVAWIMNR
jgi:hypothetical protein